MTEKLEYDFDKSVKENLMVLFRHLNENSAAPEPVVPVSEVEVDEDAETFSDYTKPKPRKLSK